MSSYRHLLKVLLCILISLIVLSGCKPPHPIIDAGDDQTSEGSLSTPKNLGTTVGDEISYYNGAVRAAESSYYEVDVTANNYYRIGIYDFFDSLDLEIYSDALFTNQLFGTVLAGDDVSQPNGSSLYIKVNATTTLFDVFRFTLDIAECTIPPGPGSAYDFGTILGSVSRTGEFVDDRYGVGSESYWYSFSLNSSFLTRIEVDPLPQLDVWMILYRVDTTLVDLEYSWVPPYGTDAIYVEGSGGYTGVTEERMETLDAGEYVIRVSHAPGTLGDYELRITFP